MKGRIVYPGSGAGTLLPIEKPISFWGGVDPKAGTISDPRHPQFGVSLADRVVLMPRTIGSSSSSAIMLELLRNKVAPAAILLGNTDAILVLGLLVAESLGYPTIPVVELDSDQVEILSGLAEAPLQVTRGGVVRTDAPR